MSFARKYGISKLRIQKAEEMESRHPKMAGQTPIGTLIGSLPMFLSMVSLAFLLSLPQALIYRFVMREWFSGEEIAFHLFPFIAVPLLMGMLYGPSLTISVGFVVTAFIWAASSFNPCTFIVAMTSTIFIAVRAPRLRRNSDVWHLLGNLIFYQVFVAIAVMVAQRYLLSATEITPIYVITQFVGMFIFAFIGVILALYIFLPIIEKISGRISDYSLMRYTNVGSQLLLRLSREAPGTYAHTLTVADLAQAAADAIGADGLLARVGAFYHDVGKLSRPALFMENQSGKENPHNPLPPSISRMIIAGHVKEGLILAQGEKLPPAVLRIIATHHGTTNMQWFKLKAEEQAAASPAGIGRNGAATTDGFYRYQGPLPKSREETIVMIADSVEAASRSLGVPDIKAVSSLVDKIILGKLTDGQFASSEITCHELDIIKGSLVSSVIHHLHSRKAYPPKK